MEKVGLILAGGGGKGAYEVGSWIALHKMEMIKELDITIDAISGTSVGALNAGLFACNSPEEVEKIWSEVNPPKILSLDLKRYFTSVSDSVFSDNILNQSIRTFVNMSAITLGVGMVKNVLENGIFSREGLIEIINESNIEERINCCNKNVIACCKNTKDDQIEYIKLNCDNYKDVLLASSALPIIFGKQSIAEKKYYRDGGVLGDNLPILPLLSPCDKLLPFYKKFIIIHLDDNDIKQFNNLNLQGCKIYHIFPEKNLGGVWGLFDFTQKGINKRKKQAIREMEENYKYIQEIKELFEDNSVNEMHFSKGQTYGTIEELYYHLQKEKKVTNNDEFVRSIKNNEEVIYINDSKLSKYVSVLISLSKKNYMIVFSALTAIMTLGITSVATLNIPALAVVTPAVVPALAIVGEEMLIGLIGLMLVCKSRKTFSRIRGYSCEEQEDGSLLLVSNKYIENEIEEMKDLYNCLT